MKKLTRLFAILAALMMVMACTATSFATLPDEGYGYTIKVYAGNEGKFVDPKVGTLSDNGKTLTIKVDAGEAVTIDQSTTGLTMNKDSEYYLRGFRIAGQDAGLGDGEVSNPTITVDADASYQASYGLKGGMVSYVIQYLDINGNALRDEDTYYGMSGDKPVVSYKYIEGYTPTAYNTTKRLVDDESENIIPFIYLAKSTSGSASDDADDTDTAANANTNRNNAGAANGNNPAASNPALASAVENAQNNGPAEVVDLDDNNTPLAENATTDSSGAEESSGVSKGVLYGVGAVIVAAAAAVAAVAIKRRREEEYEDEDE